MDSMDTIDAQPANSHADGGVVMPNDRMTTETWQRIDEVGHSHHIVIWMVILELEADDYERINTSAVQRRLFRWTGEFPSDDRVNRSMNRLLKHELLEREQVTEWPHGYHWTTTADGVDIARQVALKWLRLLDCEDRGDLHEIDPEAEAAADGEGGGKDAGVGEDGDGE